MSLIYPHIIEELWTLGDLIRVLALNSSCAGLKQALSHIAKSTNCPKHDSKEIVQ